MKKKFALLLGFIFILSVAMKVKGEDNNLYRIHSLFLYNFTKHIKWKNSDEVFTIGVFLNVPVMQELEKNLYNRTVWNNKIKIIFLKKPEDIAKCHLVYIPKSNPKKIGEFINNCDFNNKLLVTEEDLLESGAAISFVLIDSKLNFKISKSKVEASGLKVSNSLLSVGIAV